MPRRATIRISIARTTVAIVFLAAAGCLHHPMRRAGVFPPGAIPAPPGTYTCQWQEIQAARARADELVIYEAEWIDGTDRMGPALRKRLASVAERGGDFSCPLLLEEGANAELNVQRQLAVSAYLAEKGLDLPPEAVVVGFPEAFGLHGQEAESVSRSMFRGGSQQDDRGITPFSGFSGGFRGGMEGGYNSL